MHELRNVLRDTITMGLKRKSSTRCSTWAENYRIMGSPFPGNYSFKYHPWTRDMHDSEAPLNTGQKAAQVGYTEAVLNRTFFKMDVHRVDCLYILPSKTPDASDFSAARFDPAIQLSPHLTAMFSDVKNVGHKRAGSTNLYIRGSNSRPGLKSVPVGFLVFDEVDEMTQENRPLALERLSGQLDKQIWQISTPTIPDFGINVDFQKSTQEHFFFKCPGCSKQIELTLNNLVICGNGIEDPDLHKSHIICLECKKVLKQPLQDAREYALRNAQLLENGLWVPTHHHDMSNRGFYINQLYSSTISPVILATSWFHSQGSKSYEQELYNSKLGLAHIVEGARIDDTQILKAMKDYLNGVYGSGLITMGVDVGTKWIHYEIDEWEIRRLGNDLNIMSDCKALKVGKVTKFEELDTLMREYQVQHCIVDAFPERRNATNFARRFDGHVHLCFYSRGITQNDIQFTEDSLCIRVDRTSWLDLALGRFHSGGIQIPKDIPTEYKKHLKALTRVYERDADGNPVGKYLKTDEDHYAHARCYSEVALPLAASLISNENIENFL